MIEGALEVSYEKLVNHFMIISKHIYPKVEIKNIICGINSKKKSKYFLKNKEFNPLRIIPKDIWITPTIILNFILKELRKDTSV